MKNILRFLSIENLKNIVFNTFSRFPIPMLIAIIVAGIFIYLNHGDTTQIIEEKLYVSILSLIITFFLSSGVYIFTESFENKKLIGNILKIASILFGIFFYFTYGADINNFENVIFFILTLSGIISFLYFSPYLFKNTKQSIYYTYFYNISVVFLTSFILGGVLFSLGAIAITTIIELFDLNFYQNEKLILDWAVISLSLITPIFALNGLPNKKSFTNNYFNENAFFGFMTKYIAIPFIYIYFIILYAYTIKVLSNFSEWPKGEVSWMVIGFSTFGYIIYIFSYIFEQKNKFIRIFRKSFPYVVIPQIFMLAYAIFLRLNQYDLTVNRYFVVVFGLILLITSLYYIFSKKKNLSFVATILTLFTIIISIGPWGVYSLPESRQYDRLETNLIKAKILDNTKGVPSEKVIVPLQNYNDISEELSKNIYSGIDYICDFNNCEQIKTLFKNQYDILYNQEKLSWKKNQKESIEKYKELLKNKSILDKKTIKYNEELLEKTELESFKNPNKWTIIREITKQIKVKNYYKTSERRELSFHLKSSVFPINTTGYKQIIEVNSYNNNNNAYLDITGKYIKIGEDKIDLNELIKKLVVLNTGNDTEVSKNNLTYENEKYKIILEYINIKNPGYKGEQNPYLNGKGYILVK